jgi:hypothetical protein
MTHSPASGKGIYSNVSKLRKSCNKTATVQFAAVSSKLSSLRIKAARLSNRQSVIVTLRIAAV